MGNLVTETPYSEVTATLELLNRLGVDREGLKNFRKASSHIQVAVARLMQGDGSTSAGRMMLATKPLDPASFIGKGWEFVAKECCLRTHALTEIDWAKVEFVTCLNEGESSITGEEKLKRLKSSGAIRLGSSAFNSLWLDYQARKAESVLEQLFKEQNLTYIDFFGDVLLYPLGHRLVLCLDRDDGGRWHWSYRWLGHVWDASDRSAVSAS